MAWFVNARSWTSWVLALSCLSYIGFDCCLFLQNLYSCRAELDTNIEKLSRAIEHANLDSDNEQVLKDAIEAESVLPLMQSLRDRDDKFRSVHELKEGIDQLQKVLKEMNGFKARLPVAKKIQKLKDLVALGGYDLESCETFELSDKKKQIKVGLLLQCDLNKTAIGISR